MTTTVGPKCIGIMNNIIMHNCITNN